MKIIFAVHGLGEYAQAQAVADLLQKKKESVFFLTKDPLLKEIAFNDNFSVIEIQDHVNKTIENIEADALFLCNSHTTIAYDLVPPKKIKKVFSIDSNWLFNNKKYNSNGLHKFYTYPWIDVIYAVFSRQIYEANLIENGGYYDVDNFFKKKIYCPGFIPSGRHIDSAEKQTLREKYHINQNEKIVSTYFGNSKFHTDAFNNMVSANVKKIKFVLNEIQGEKNINFKIQNLNTDVPDLIKNTIRFDEELSISDLIIMHYGYGTLARVFHKKIPVISFIPPVESNIHSNFYELSPCINKNAIKHLFFDKFEKVELKNIIIDLLDNKESVSEIIKNQNEIFVKGEENLVDHFYKQF